MGKFNKIANTDCRKNRPPMQFFLVRLSLIAAAAVKSLWFFTRNSKAINMPIIANLVGITPKANSVSKWSNLRPHLFQHTITNNMTKRWWLPLDNCMECHCCVMSRSRQTRGPRGVLVLPFWVKGLLVWSSAIEIPMRMKKKSGCLVWKLEYWPGAVLQPESQHLLPVLKIPAATFHSS